MEIKRAVRRVDVWTEGRPDTTGILFCVGSLKALAWAATRYLDNTKE